MASMCMSQNSNYQQQQHFHLISNNSNNNSMIVLQQQSQQAACQRQFVNHKLPALAPAPTKILTPSNVHNIQPPLTNPMMINKKRYNYGTLPYGMEQLPSVARRNARERNRVKQVNNGFANLRQHIPQTVIAALSHGGRGASKKLSKVDTLRIAVEYIRGLQTLLESSQSSSTRSSNNSNDFPDDCSSDVNSYECSSVESNEDNMTQYQLSQSPTPSYSDSDISINGANSFIQPLKLEQTEPEYKFEPFEQADDEELLDYISSWQDE